MSMFFLGFCSIGIICFIVVKIYNLIRTMKAIDREIKEGDVGWE